MTGELARAVRKAQQSRIRRLVRHPHKMLLPRLLRFSDKSQRVTARTFWGDKIDLLLPEVVSIHIWRYGYFEADVCLYMLRLLREGMTFIDVGGHFGFFSLLAGSLVGTEGRVLAYEPTPSTYGQLQENVRSHARYPNIETLNLAAYSENTELRFHDYGLEHSAFNSAFGLRDRAAAPGTKDIVVKGAKIDDVCREKGITCVDLVKIDAESSEIHVLRGMTETLRKFKPGIIMELGDFALPSVPSSKEIITWLLSLGFSPYEICRGRIVPHIIKESYSYANLLFTAP